MDLIVYVPQEDESGRRLQEMVGRLVWQDTIEIFYTLKRLFFRLRHPTGQEDIAVLLASSTKELNELVTNSHLLNCLRIILILPDEEENTIAKGHLLRPRFISYKDNRFSDLSLVLQKMRKAACPQSLSDPRDIILNRSGV
jgi:hypothetical protein